MSPYKMKKSGGRSILAHRVIMEQILGRKLGRFEFVHHINGDKKDNRPENLELVNPATHAAKHGMWKHPTTKQCEVCGKTFTPHPTKRKLARTCGKKCGFELMSRLNRRPDAPYSMYRDGASPSRVASRKSSSKQ